MEELLSQVEKYSNVEEMLKFMEEIEINQMSHLKRDTKKKDLAK